MNNTIQKKKNERYLKYNGTDENKMIMNVLGRLSFG